MLSSALLGVLVVAAAGLAGTVHFPGPRWVPDWRFGALKARKLTPPKLHLPSTTRPMRVSPSHPSASVPFGQVVLWIVVGVAAIGVAALVRWLWNRRSVRVAPSWQPAAAMTRVVPIEPEPDPDAATLRSGIEVALQTLDEQREPADAVVRAWLGLQETAESSGIVRRPSETPTEFTSRILSRAFVDDRAVRTLLRLYLQTRFGDHAVTSEDVASVRTALQELVRTWPVPTARVGSGRR